MNRAQDLKSMEFPQKRRVVVTGLGMITPLGLDINSTWRAILAGESGVKSITRFDTSKFRTKFAACIQNFSLDPFLEETSLKKLKGRVLDKMDPFIQYGFIAAREAIQDARLNPEHLQKHRVGLSIGSGMGGLGFIESQHQRLLKPEYEPRQTSPYFIAGTIINMTSGLLSMEYGFTGPNLALATACSTGSHNIGIGARTIAYGDADVMIVGGAEMAVTPLGLAGFSSCGALSTRNEDPVRASRPWDKDRNGFVLGEGAGVLVLEAYEHAKARNAPIYAELAGFGMSADAFDLTSPPPQGEGASQAMRHALLDAGMQPEQIDYINAHATSTLVGDRAELTAIKNTFGSHSTALAISSTKSMLGHSLGATGAVEAAFCVLAIRDQVAPPTINLEHPDDGCDLNLVPRTAQYRPIKAALSNSFAFGGTNGALIFSQITHE